MTNKRISYMSVFNLPEIWAMREAFYSCKIEGINAGMTFKEFLEIEFLHRTKRNTFRVKDQKRRLSGKAMETYLEGDNTYIGDYWISGMGAVCTVFYNANPNKEKGHLEYPMLFFNEDGIPTITAFSENGWSKLEKVKL